MGYYPPVTSTSSTQTAQAPLNKALIAKWSLWSWGNATVSAVMVTFVFGYYITTVVDPNDGTFWLSTGYTIAGIIIALTAPIIGQRADRGGKRKLWLSIHTLIIVGLVASCFFVRPEAGYLALGVTLMASMTLFDEFANVNYNAMITDISDHRRMGRVSGIGWGAGYLGGIVILAIALFTLVLGDPPYIFGITDDDALNVRIVAIVAAVWHLVFALPLLLTKVPTADQDTVQKRPSILESYRRLIRVLIGLWREDRNTFWFLISSAVYRDGLSAVFTYGAVLGGAIYGLGFQEIMMFGIAGNVVAALGAIVGGFLEDKVGPRKVIATCIMSLIGVAVILYFFDVERVVLGAEITPFMAFWIFGLFLCLFVGPAQASSRAFLGRLAPPDRAAELFGLYATTGRSVGFITSALIMLILGAEATTDEGADKAIIVAIIVVFAVGLALLSQVRNPTGPAKMREHGVGSGGGETPPPSRSADAEHHA
ncbi:MFS transporter [Nesterenkonia flava]